MSSLLRKRFDSSKCKTLLQLSSQRLKVLRNKHTLAVKKARADVAKFLEKNEDSNAGMQVETVFREEQILALYDLLDHFSQLVINGLESIKSQKECPLDLKEAVASLIFAAPKCDNLEELKKVSKYLTLKYGTDFYVAAKELRPDCGVNKQIIQSLSARPPDFEEKLKLLKEIAVENKINWDHNRSIADVPKGPRDLIDGPIYFGSAAELSRVGSHVITNKPKSKSVDVNELRGQGNAVLQNALGSRTMSVADSLSSPHYDTHQFSKINSMVSDHVTHTPVLDPYARARAAGNMDYKAVLDHMKGAESMELKQEDTDGVLSGKTATHLRQKESGQNVFLDAAHGEDALQTLKGKKDKQKRDMKNAHRRNEEELLELQNAAEFAYASANHAAEAARAAVTMVRMESLERLRSKEQQEMRVESRSALARDENDELPGMDAKHLLNRHRLSCEGKGMREPSPYYGMAGDPVSDMNLHHTADASEDSFKCVVFEQTSNWQNDTHSSAQAGGYKKNSDSYAFPEVWSEPPFYSRKNSDKIIFDTENEEFESKEILTNVLFDDFRSDSMQQQQQELDKKASSWIKEERIYTDTEAHQDKHVQSDLSVPQFDDYSSDEDDYMPQNLPAPQVEDKTGEEVNEEEVPFYLRGRAAMASKDNANVSARAPHTLLPSLSFSTDDEVEESSTNVLSSEQKSSVHIGLSVEPLGVSNDKDKPSIVGTSSSQYDVDEGSQKSSFVDDYEELESLPTSSSETLSTHQIGTKSTSESSIMSPAAYKDSSVKPTTPRNLKWPASITEEWDFDPGAYKLDSPLGSAKLPSLNEIRGPSSQVNRKLNLSSGASEDFESMSERSLDSPKSSFTTGAAQVPEPATRKPYAGVSKRSVRSARSRQNQDVRSLSSTNEDIKSH